MSDLFESISVEYEIDDNFLFELGNLQLEEEFYFSHWIKLNLYNNNFVVFFNLIQNSIFQDIISGYSFVYIKNKYSSYKDDINFVYIILIYSNFFSKKTKNIFNYGEYLFLYITDKCNLNCYHCYRKMKNNSNKNIFSNNKLKEFINEFCSNGGKYVTISGGEPLLSEYFIDYINYMYNLRLNITVLSNGILWKDLFENNIPTLKKITEIQISLDGYDNYTNSLIRNSYLFNTTIDNINWLLKNNVNLLIAMTIHPDILKSNMHFEKLVKFIKTYIDRGVSFSFTKKFISNDFIILDDDSANNYYKNVVRLNKIIYPYGNLARISRFYSNSYAENNCGWGGITIDYDGLIYLCNRTSEITQVGDIEYISYLDLKEISNEAQHTTSVDNIKPCCDCSIRYICNGGCRIDNFDFKKFKNNNKCEIIKNKIYDDMIKYIRVIYGM